MALIGRARSTHDRPTKNKPVFDVSIKIIINSESAWQMKKRCRVGKEGRRFIWRGPNWFVF